MLPSLLLDGQLLSPRHAGLLWEGDLEHPILEANFALLPVTVGREPQIADGLAEFSLLQVERVRLLRVDRSAFRLDGEEGAIKGDVQVLGICNMCDRVVQNVR
jgi:hypothetical protein